ncbi:MAG TPA: helix-turn-helix transcriptional regulator [Azospirillaceae bacterium]|nr:helix-turn-helix transcriptional regulator [Azospirillaceae bacterium]
MARFLSNFGYIRWCEEAQRHALARMDIRVQFGQILREKRKACGLTQEELAFRAGMDVTYVSDLERGKWNPSLAVLVDLANGLNLNPSQLLEGLMTKGAPPSRKRSNDSSRE